MAKVRSGERLRAYRESYNYRAEYFKKNPGIFGCVWFCSQCYKPLIGRQNVVIDHIVPLSRGGLNRVSNCTAICRKCNLAKSDRIDGRIAKGAAFKFFESNVFRASRGVGGAFALGAGLTAGAARGTFRAGTGILGGVFRLGWGAISGVTKLVTFPLTHGSVVSRLFFTALYTLGILYFLSTYTSLLSAWL